MKESLDSNLFRNHIIEETAQKGINYQVFLALLKLYQHVDKTRGMIFQDVYAAMRAVDDYVDGDVPLPAGFPNAVQYVQEKMDYVHKLGKPSDNVDFLLGESIQLGDSLGVDFRPPMLDILSSLKSDAERRQNRKVLPSKELQKIYESDISGCVKGSLLCTRGSDSDYELVRPLGMATRIRYNNRDLEREIANGIVNISSEDITSFGIDIGDFRRESSPVQAWLEKEMVRGREYLQEYLQRKNGLQSGAATKLALFLPFELPARIYFKI